MSHCPSNTEWEFVIRVKIWEPTGESLVLNKILFNKIIY